MQMKFINLNYTLYLNNFNIQFLEQLFQVVGKLPEGSFNIVVITLADGNLTLAFVYPTKYTKRRAQRIVERIFDKIRYKTIGEINDLVQQG